MMTRRSRHAFRRAPKTRVFWYAPTDSSFGTTSQVLALDTDVVIPIVAVPKDVAATSSLATAAEAPHNDRCVVHRVIGSILYRVPAAATTLILRAGLLVRPSNFEEGGIGAAGIFNATLDGSRNDLSWLWLDDAFVQTEAVATGPCIMHVDSKVKRVLKQGDVLGLVLRCHAYQGATGASVTVNLRALLSTAR